MSAFVTRTATPLTAVCAEVVHVIDVALTTVTPVHAVDDPIATVAPARKPVPVIVTFCKPATSPEVGVIAVTVGAAMYVKSLVPVPVCKSELVTTTFLSPAVPTGDVHVIDVADTTVTDVHETPPTATEAPAVNPVPEIVIVVPPTTDPLIGEIDDTVGGET